MQLTRVIGIDLGGTKIEAARVDSNGIIEERLRVLTDVEGGVQKIAEQIIDLALKLKKKSPSTIQGIGIGIPGQIDAGNESVLFAPNLHWKNVNLKELLASQVECPIFVGNDVRVATCGEWLFGAGKGCKNFVCLFLGTGIGGGIVLYDKLITGSSNSAGELGHTCVKFDGPLCTCGNRGCMEAFAGGWGIAEQAKERVRHTPEKGKSLLEQVSGNADSITALHVSESFRQKDPLAKEVVDQAAKALVAGSISIVNGLNPELLIFGGGLLKGFPQFVSQVDEGIKQHALKAALPHLKVLPSTLQGDASLLGAASLPLFAKKY